MRDAHEYNPYLHDNAIPPRTYIGDSAIKP
jgi:hypothetical protein